MTSRSPDRDDADIISFAAGHKALGIYALWALRNEIARIAVPELLPKKESQQLRLEDLLGFRRNPITRTPAFPEIQRQGPGWPSDPGDAFCPAIDRRLGRRRRHVAPAWPSGPETISVPTDPRSMSSKARAA